MVRAQSIKTHFAGSKKNSISPSDLKMTHNSALVTDPGPSLGVLGRNFMEILNIGSVWSASVGVLLVQKLGNCKVWKFLKLGTCNCKYPWVVANVTHGYLHLQPL